MFTIFNAASTFGSAAMAGLALIWPFRSSLRFSARWAVYRLCNMFLIQASTHGSLQVTICWKLLDVLCLYTSWQSSHQAFTQLFWNEHFTWNWYSKTMLMKNSPIDCPKLDTSNDINDALNVARLNLCLLHLNFTANALQFGHSEW